MAKAAKVNITKTFLKSLKSDEKDRVYWDDTLGGFGVRVQGKARTYIVHYRTETGRARKYTIGKVGVLTPTQARDQANIILGQVATGEDPASKKAAMRDGVTLAEVFERYMNEHARPRKKPRSVAEDQAQWDNHIKKKLGRYRVDAITRKDISSLHLSLQKMPFRANRVLALLSKVFSLAEEWGLRPDGTNPCRRIKKYPEKPRERFLTDKELARLGKALRKAEAEGKELPSVITALRLLLFTGCRRNEILALRWEHVDLENAVLRLPDSKSGAKLVQLNGPALEVLKTTQRQAGNPHVCPGRKLGEPMVNITKPWYRIRKAARIEDVRLHDLRHAFASVGAGEGLSLNKIGKLLGHSKSETTQRYAHLANDPLKEAVNLIGDKLNAALNAPVEDDEDKVVNLADHRK